MNVLYVEDNAADADLAIRQLALSAPDIVLTVAATLHDAMCLTNNAVSISPWDLILADLRLPDGTALDLAAHLRRSGIAIPLVVVTGSGDEDAAVAALKSGADDYVTKRTGYLLRLPAVLEHVLNRHRSGSRRTASPIRVLYAEHIAADIDLTLRHIAQYAPFLRLTTVGSAEEVISALTPGTRNSGSDFDCLLLDFQLPGMNAIELMKELRQDFAVAIPVVLVTGQGDEETAVQALRLGVTDYITKAPGYLFRLPGAIENAYYLARLRQESTALRESELRYRTLFDSAPVGIWTTDRTGRHLTANSTALKFWPQPPVGRTDAELLPKETATARRAVEEHVIATGEECSREERITTPIGLRTLITRTVPTRDASGAAAGTLSVGVDISEQKSLEAQLIQAQKMEAVGRLAGGVAHDFNNLLTVMGGYASLLLGHHPAGDADHDAVLQIHQAAERAGGLTRQLLAFSRRQVLRFEAIDLNVVIADLAKMLQRLIGEDVKLVTALGQSVERILADATQIDQIVINLALNARDAMPEGGTLTIETSSVVVEAELATGMSSVAPGTYALLSVSDTGCGMNQETLAQIFEPFFTTKAEGKGTGLGLSTVYGIVRQSQGYISARSELGSGTVIDIYFPATQQREVQGRQAEARAAIDTGTILLIEDENAVRKFAATVLRQGGFEVMEARTGPDALGLCKQISSPPRLLITDIVLPGIGGPVVAARMQAQYPSMKVLFISGYSDSSIAQRGIDDGAASFLQKPFAPDALLAKVRDVLGNR